MPTSRVIGKTSHLNADAERDAARVSPNPASSWLYISLENINSSVNLQIIDVNGRPVKQQLITQGAANKAISLSGMAKGLYTVKLISPERVATQKLMVQ